MRHATRWTQVLLAGGFLAVLACEKSPPKLTPPEQPASPETAGAPTTPSEEQPLPAGTPELRLQAREIIVHGWANGSIVAFLIDEDAAIKVFLPEVKGCQPEYRLPVTGETQAILYKMEDVRRILPLGGGVKPLPPTASREEATSGVIVCSAIEGSDGTSRVRLTLKDVRFASGRFREVGPVEGVPGVPPP